MRLSGLYASIHIFVFLAFVNSMDPAAVMALDAENIVKKMEAAYAAVNDYEMRVEVSGPESEGSGKTERFIYTFKRPHTIRIEYESPHKGTILIYPHKEGKVLVRPWKWMPVFQFHLKPDSIFLNAPSGQQIDETDMGLLIRNIAKSMKQRQRGQVSIMERGGQIYLGVLAENHFRENVKTRYQFLIDKALWLPVAIQESTPDGVVERNIIFQDFRVNIGVPDSLFQ